MRIAIAFRMEVAPSKQDFYPVFNCKGTSVPLLSVDATTPGGDDELESGPQPLSDGQDPIVGHEAGDRRRGVLLMMPQRVLGVDGPSVGAVGLGCMGMSWAYATRGDDERSVSIIHRAIELGVTLFDTADMYGPFTNELLVGRALQGRTGDVVIASKCGNIVDPSTKETTRNGTPDHIKSACDASLQRLGVEVIDLYQLHRPDPAVPIEESVGAFGELVDEGKIGAIGLSEVSIDELRRAHATRAIASLQSELSLWTREPLEEIVPFCEAQGIAFLPFAPLGRGFLTGRFRSSAEVPTRDYRSRLPRFQAEALEANLALVDVLDELAVGREGTATAGQIALAWLLAQSQCIIPIPGTTDRAHLEANVCAAELSLTEAELERLSAMPSAAGERY